MRRRPASAERRSVISAAIGAAGLGGGGWGGGGADQAQGLWSRIPVRGWRGWSGTVAATVPPSIGRSGRVPEGPSGRDAAIRAAVRAVTPSKRTTRLLYRSTRTGVKPKTQDVVVRSAYRPLHDVPVDEMASGRGQARRERGRPRSRRGNGVDRCGRRAGPGVGCIDRARSRRDPIGGPRVSKDRTHERFRRARREARRSLGRGPAYLPKRRARCW